MLDTKKEAFGSHNEPGIDINSISRCPHEAFRDLFCSTETEEMKFRQLGFESLLLARGKPAFTWKCSGGEQVGPDLVWL